MTHARQTYTTFAGQRLIVSGDLETVLLRTKRHLDRGGSAVLIFEDQTGRQVDFNLSGTADDVLARAGHAPQTTGPGRPKLGVICREVCLLPRHWDWLEAQPNGASAALRRLVDEARKREPEKERARDARDAAAKFMWVMAGDLPGFEEATRALFAGDQRGVERLVRGWPTDVRRHVLRRVREAARLEQGDENGPLATPG
jgi:hypothetical protein